MEGIKNYGESSDSQEDSGDDSSERATSGPLHFSDKTSQQQPDNRPCVELAVAKGDAIKTLRKSTVPLNFLGLDVASKGNSSIFSVSQTHNHQVIRKVQTSSGELEIPSGDFWKDFTPEYPCSATKQGEDNSESHLRQTGSGDNHKSCATNNNGTKTNSTLSLVNISKRLHHDNNLGNFNLDGNLPCKQIRLSGNNTYTSDSLICSQDFVHKKHRGLENPRQSQHTETAECSNNSEQTKTLEKRKLYYIHSNVSLYLNMQPVNKCSSKLLNSWSAHDGVVNRLAWNVPSFSHLLVTAGMDASVRVWNVWSSLDLCVATLGCHKKAVKHVEWCHTGRRVLSCSYDRTAQVTDVETAKTLGQYEHMNFVTAGHIHQSNPNVFLTGTDNMVLKWDMRTPQAPVRFFSYKDKFGQVQDLLLINHGQEFVSCSDLISRDSADRSIMVWDLRAGTVLSNQIFQERYLCTRLKLHPSQSTFMAQTHAGYVAMFSTTTPYKMDKAKRYEGHKIQGHNIGFDISPDGSLIYSGSAGHGIHIYHQQSGRLMKKLSSRNDTITDVACHPVLPSFLASCTWGGSVNLWR